MRYGATVIGVGRAGRDLLVDSGREEDDFAVHVEVAGGVERLVGRAVVDASGTWRRPNPLGADGYPALGEREHADRIGYGIPDFADPDVAARYAGKHVVLAGKGASAQGALVGLTRLAEADPATRVTWLLRRPAVGDAFGGGDNDQLRERGRLGQTPRGPPPRQRAVTTVTRFRTEAVRAQSDGRLTVDVGRRPAGRRRRRGGRRDRVPPRPRLPLRGTARPGPGAGVAAGAGRPDPPRPPQLRRRGTRTGTAS